MVTSIGSDVSDAVCNDILQQDLLEPQCTGAVEKREEISDGWASGSVPPPPVRS